MADGKTAKFAITAENQTQRAFNEIKRSMGEVQTQALSLKNALISIGSGLALTEIFNSFKEVISGAAALDDFAEKTGASVENLSKLQQVARISGQDFAGVTDVMVRLSRALAGADEESKGAGAALAKLGLNAAELRKQDPSEALRRVAEELNKYADGGGKAALVTELLGKSGAQVLPFLKDLATETGIAAKVTGDQAAKAEELEKMLKRLALESYNAKQAISLSLLPTLVNTVEQFNEGRKAAGGFLQAIIAFGTLNPFKSAGESLKGLREDLEKAQTERGRVPDFQKGFFDSKIEDIKKQIEFTKVLQRQQALASGGGDTPGERARFPGAALPILDFVKPGSPEKAGSGKTREIENVIKSLEKESIKVDALGKEYETLLGIELGLYGKVTEEEKKRAVSLGRLIDLSKESSDEEKRRGEEIKNWADEQQRAAKEAETLAQRWRDLADPTQEQNRRLQEGLELLKQQRITIQEFNAGANPRLTSLLNPEKTDRDVLNEALKEGDISTDKYLEAIKRLNGELDKTKETSNEIFEKLSSAFEDAIINGKKFSDVLKGIGQDILKLFIRSQITEPAAKSFAEGFKDFAIGSIFKAFLGGEFSGSGGDAIGADLFGFAAGGEFRVGGSGGTDSQLVAFRASPNETVSIRTPAQQGAGGGQPIVMNSTYNFGSDVNRSTLASWADAIERKTIASVANLASRGGSYSRAVRG